MYLPVARPSACLISSRAIPVEDKGERLYVVLQGRIGVYFPAQAHQRYEDVKASLSDDIYEYSIHEYKKSMLKLVKVQDRDTWFGEVGLLNAGGPMHSVAVSEEGVTVHLMVIEQREYMRYFAEKETAMLKQKLKIFQSNVFADCSLQFQRLLYYMSRKVSFK